MASGNGCLGAVLALILIIVFLLGLVGFICKVVIGLFASPGALLFLLIIVLIIALLKYIFT